MTDITKVKQGGMIAPYTQEPHVEAASPSPSRDFVKGATKECCEPVDIPLGSPAPRGW